MKTPWTPKEIEILHLYYAVKGGAGLAKTLGRTSRAIGLKARKLGLKFEGRRSSLFDGTTGNTEIWKYGKKTRFKPGNLPHNTRKAGQKYKRKDHGKTYWFIREAGARKSRPLHRVMWEEKNGPVPDGHLLTFTDGDTLNCRLSNIECITRAEHATRCSALRSKKTNQEIGIKAWTTRERNMRIRLGLPVKQTA